MTFDLRLEKFLETRQIPFLYHESISLAEINWEKSQSVQVRVEILHKSTIDRYAYRLRNNEQPPAIVAYNDHSRWVLLDGIQRAQAFIVVGQATADCYEILSTDQFLLDLLKRTLNLILNGDQELESHYLESAVKFHLTYPKMSIKDVAAAFHIETNTLSRHVRAAAARVRLASAGVNSSTFGVTILETLASLKSDPVQQEAARLIAESRIGVLQARELVEDITAQRSDVAALERIQAWRKRPDVQSKQANHHNGRLPRVSQTAKQKLFSHLNSSIQLMEGVSTLAELAITSADDIRLLKEMTSRFNKLARGLLS